MHRISHVCSFKDCEATFFRPSKLAIHLRKHSGERPFVCDEENCNKSYTNSSHLRRHKTRSHQKNVALKIQCTVEDCNRNFSNADNLKRHLRTVHSKEYVCKVCQETFHKKSQLRSHMYQHPEELEFKCDICNLIFLNHYLLKKHQRNHKTYSCSCGEVFLRWTALLKHRKEVHKKKFKCEICQKEIMYSNNYRYHLQLHDKEREVFECPIENCDRLYYYKRNLQLHIDVFHSKRKKYKKLEKTEVKEKQRPKTLETGRKSRKDKGIMKKSTALAATGLQIPYEFEKKILSGEKLSDSNVEIDSSDFSDIEVTAKILKIKTKDIINSNNVITVK